MTHKKMSKTLVTAAAIAIAIAGGLIASSPTHAEGFFAPIANAIIPGSGTAGDAYIGAIRDRSSDASVFNHVFGGLGQYNQPFRPAQPAGPRPPAYSGGGYAPMPSAYPGYGGYPQMPPAYPGYGGYAQMPPAYPGYGGYARMPVVYPAPAFLPYR